MTLIAKALSLSSDSIADVAAYCAGLNALFLPLKAPDAALVKRGEQLAKMGSAKHRVQACDNCHGPEGAGELPTIPYLAGQYAPPHRLHSRQVVHRFPQEQSEVDGGRRQDARRTDLAAVVAYYQQVRGSGDVGRRNQEGSFRPIGASRMCPRTPRLNDADPFAYQAEHVVARNGRKEVDAMSASRHIVCTPSRRRFLQSAGVLGGMATTFPAWADAFVNLDLPGGPNRRELTTAFPQKGQMILQRTRPPLLETPWDVFDRGVFTPNDQFFVRWHWAVIPKHVDVAAFRLTVRGHVNQALSLSLADLLAMPRVELVAVLQCSGNSRGFFQPRVPGARMAKRGHGKCAVDRRPLARRAGSRGCQGRRCCGSIQRFGQSGRRGSTQIHETARHRPRT